MQTRLVFFFMLALSVLRAQEARLAGTVTDPSGAVLVGVTVTATQTERNLAFTAQSDTEGRYLFPRLPIGPYSVSATHAGFKSVAQSGIALTTSADSMLNIVMQIGDISEKVTVSAEASRVSAESSTIQQLVDTKRILDLPLNGRDVYQLARLVPGVGQSGVNIGGGRSGSQNSGMANVRVDGSLNVDNVFQQILPSPSPDAVQEFTIQTSVPSAKYGYASGVIEISTRSGTNALHGSLYEFLRNDKLDARNFFLPTKTKRKRNQYGFAGGGPVYIPKIYNGRDRTFWFVNLEQQKEPLGAATTLFVATQEQTQGDFSRFNRTIRDPLNNQNFPNNQIPASRLDPLAVNFSKQYVPVAQDALGTYRYQRANDNNPNQALLRGDQSFAQGKQQLSARMFITRRSGPTGHGNLPAFQIGTVRLDTDLYGLTHTSILAPGKINTARFSLNGYYTVADYRPQIELADLKKLGFADNYYTYTPDFPVLNVTGFFQASIEQIKISRDYNTFAFSDDFSWIHGRHNLQFGFDGIRSVQTDNNLSRSNGSYSFSGVFSGSALTDFMLGRPATFRQGSPAPDDTRGLHLAWYAQDDVRLSRRLTLNLGLRYDLPLPPLAINDAAMLYRAGAQSKVYVNAPPGVLFYGDPDVPRAGRSAVKNLFAPRVGFAYALTADQKTLIRAGYGIYYNPTWSNVEGQFAIYQPFTRIVDINPPPSTSNPWSNFPGGNPHPYKPGKDSVFDKGITGLSYGPNFTELSMQQWNLNLQREVARDWLITVGYAGARGTHIPYLRDVNQAIYIPGASTVANVDARRPLAPYFSRFSFIESVVNSSYHSLQASVDRRFRGGLTVLMSYTFSKSLTDLNSVLTNNGGVQNADDRRAEWGPSDFDRTHAFVTSWVYQIPNLAQNRFAKAVVNGWEVNGIWSMYSGAPLQFATSQDRALRGQPNRPDRIKDPRLDTGRSRAELITQYFDRSAFVPNQTGQFGSAPRAEGQLHAPGTFDVTAGVQKRWRGIRESDRIQFRTELFNAFNRPNFGSPGANPDSSGSYGRITSASDGRIIQFGLKYVF
ncbi:MAG TPA: carboxypeptidase regulatory-like domain-containing protein [Bryobacteraceae bacterium]|nr:carboxypeptidase regulatory-like domain-containing protein [Bryobacteraceae bacterium]